MKTICAQLLIRFVLLAASPLLFSSRSLAVDSIWTNTTGGAWETANYWSSGTAPSNNFNMLWITNGAASKIIALWDGIAPISALTVSNVTVSAPGGYVNTLAVGYNNVGSPSALNAGTFDILNSLIISNGGAFLHGIGTTRVDGVSGGGFNINGGSATISNGLFITTNAYSYIGYYNNGQMTVAGGTWLAKQVEVGENASSSGTLTIAGGTNNLSALLEVGVNGTGTVWITSGQLITTNGMTVIGYFNNSVGRMTVSNDTWLARDVALGYNAGSQGTLTIAGGIVSLASNLSVGANAGGTGTVWLTGGQLTTTNGGNAGINIGDSGVGRMTISNGTWRSSMVRVGYNAGSQGTLTIAGGTNIIAAASSLIVGAGAGSTGTVWLTGGQLVTTNGIAGIGNSGIGQMTVSNGTWLAKQVYVGNFNTSGTLTIAGGTNQFFGDFNVAANTSSTGAVWITGGQLITTNNPAVIGYSGPGQLTVSNGTWWANSGTVCFSSAGSGSSLTIAGGTNYWASQLQVARFGTGSVLVTSGLLSVTNGDTTIGWYGTGSMTVSGGTWQAQNVFVGYLGSRCTLTIAGGTNILTGTGSLSVGTWADATGTVNVTGGTLIATNATGEIGGYGSGQMNISSGNVALAQMYIAYQNGSQGTLTISGGATEILRPIIGQGTGATGTVWLTGGQLITTNVFGSTTIGQFGVGRMTVSNGTWLANSVTVADFGGAQGTLTIAGGNSLLSSSLTIGNSAGATGTVTVSGGAIVVTNSSGTGALTVGGSGRGNYTQNGGNVIVDRLFITNGASSWFRFNAGTLTVQNGLTVKGNIFVVGNQAGSAATLNLLGGTNQSNFAVQLGQFAGATGTVYLGGGYLVTTNNYVGIGYSGVGQMYVTGGVWQAKTVYLGMDIGTSGMLTIAGGTNLMLWGSYPLYVGYVTNSTGTVLMTGGLLVTSNVNTYAYIGCSGVGQMTVSGGTWQARNIFVGRYAGAQGTLTVAGGTVLADNTLTIGNDNASVGTVLLSGGQLSPLYSLIGFGGSGAAVIYDGLWQSVYGYLGCDGGGSGTLTILGGTNVYSSELGIGNYNSATGTVWLAGGQLITTNALANIGNGGVGQISVYGGTWQAGNVNIGNEYGSQGTLTVAGGSCFATTVNVGFLGNGWLEIDSGDMTLTGALNVSPTSVGVGTVIMYGGQLTVTNAWMDIGQWGPGQLTLNGFGRIDAREISVGMGNSGTGTLTVNGGELHITGTAGFGLALGWGGNGTLWVNGGFIEATNAFIEVGRGGTGAYNQSGGLVQTRDLYVGHYAGSRGTFYQSGGTLVVLSNFVVGAEAAAIGSVSVNGGSLIVNNTGSQILVGNGGDATMSINGGTVNARELRVGNGASAGTLGIWGGTLTGGSVVVTPSGILQLGSGGWLSSIVSNQGVIQFYANPFTFHGGLDNLANLNLPANQIVTVQGGLGNEGVIIAGAGSVLNADSFRNGNHNGIMFLNSAAQLNVTAAWTNNGALELTQGTIAGGTIQNASYIEGIGAVLAPVVNNAGGTIRANGGLLALAGASIQNQAGGYLEATDGSTLRINRSFANQGFINPQGGLIDLGVNTLTNQGTLTGYGTYKAALIVNQNRATFTGGNLDMQSAYLNSAGATTTVLRISANFFGAFTNDTGAYFKNTGGNVTWFGIHYNNGTEVSDPAMNIYNGSLVLGPTGILAGGDGDVFVIAGDLMSANPTGLQLAGATVEFNAGAHTFTLSGTATIGTLQLDSGATVSLIGGDLLVGKFSADTNQLTTAQTIYYDPAQNPSLGAQSYALNGGGSLTAVPEPSSALLVLLGVVAAATTMRRRFRT